MFDEIVCHKCFELQPRVYPYIHCEARLANLRKQLTYPCFQREAEAEVWGNAWKFLWAGAPYRKAHRRLHFLRCALVAHESTFRRFAYYYAGITGSISQREDIIDRILSFLVPTFSPSGRYEDPQRCTNTIGNKDFLLADHHLRRPRRGHVDCMQDGSGQEPGLVAER